MSARPLAALLAALFFAAPAVGAELVLEVTSEREFRRPHNVTLSPDGASLYLADNANDRVVELDPTTLAIRRVIGSTELLGPHDVEFDSEGLLWVADSVNNRIVAYDLSGETPAIVREWEDGLASPEGLAMAGNGDIVVGNAASHKIKTFDRNGKATGVANSYFDRPHDVAVHPDGRVFVADSGNDRLVVLGPDLEEQRALKGPPWNFHEPKYLAIAEDGHVLVTDEYNNRVVVLNGETLEPIGQFGNSVLDRPEGIAVRGEMIWVVDTYNNRLHRYRWTR